MRILFFGNNWVGWKLAEWLHQQGEELVGLVLHPPARRSYGDEIIKSAGGGQLTTLNGDELSQERVLETIAALKPDIGVSAFFGYILRSPLLNLLPSGCVNVHPAFLPFNRGAHPNVWTIIDGTPAGVTIHYMDEGVDTGDIIARRELAVEPVDTGQSLYRKLEQASVELFKETWPLVTARRAERVPQGAHEGTCHRVRDVQVIDEIDLDRTYKAREIIDIIRARTFPPYPGAYFTHEGRKVFLSLHLSYDGQSEETKGSGARGD